MTESVVGFFTRDRSQLHTWSTIVQGVVGLIVALVLVIAPGAALRFVVLLIAAWLLVRGAIHLYLSIKAGDNPGIAMVSVTSGVISAIVGLLLLVRPEAGVIAVSWLVGIFAILTGTFSLLLARRLKPDVEVEAEEVSPESDQ